MTRIELSIAAFMVSAGGLFLFGLFALALARGMAQRRRKTAAAALTDIRDALVVYLSGAADDTALRGYAGTQRQSFTEAVLAFQNTVSGAARDRLCNLALETGLVRESCEETHSQDAICRRTAYARLAFFGSYEPCQRVAGDLLVDGLDDPDREVRLAACRGVLRAGDPSEVETIFDYVVSQDLLSRIQLSDDLRRHALLLCERAVPEVLHSTDARRVLAGLQILAAWERAVPVDDLDGLMLHGDREIRLWALRLARVCPLTEPNRVAISRSLSDDDLEICTAAAVAAGAHRMEDAIDLLADCVRRGTAELARTAAGALASMPAQSWSVLEEMAASPEPGVAAAACGALGLRGAGPG